MIDAVNRLDEAADALAASLGLARDVLAVAETMDAQPLLRRSLSEPNIPPAQHHHLVESLFGQVLSPEAVGLVEKATDQNWPNGRLMAGAIRDAASRIAWWAAISNDVVEIARQQLFSLIILVDRDPALATSLGDVSRELADRRALVGALTEKAEAVAGFLAQAATSDTRADFTANLSRQLDILAELRGHRRAIVTTAVPMTPQQRVALKTQLVRLYDSPVDLEAVVDPRVVGGVRVDVGGDVIDGSYKARLDAAREAMATITVEADETASEDGRDA